MGSETGEILTAGFRDTLVTVSENAGVGKLAIDFSQTLAQETKVTVMVSAEENMQENKDFFLTSKILSVAAGEKSVDVEYALVDDNEVNDGRGFTLKLVALNGGSIDEKRADVKIKVLDDESEVAVGFEKTEMTVQEREPGSQEEFYCCQIPVKVFGTIQKPIQFKVVVRELDEQNEAVEGVHFRLVESVFVLNNATDVVSVPVEIVDDNEVNTDRVFALDIVEVVGAEVNTAYKRCVVMIENDDAEVSD
ncbi:MAG: hypothetical protein K2L23_01795 [Odoribacter sp.]|nr:hypothetical protein [Odoribacter sp.]